jgi:hypothetical protein
VRHGFPPITLRATRERGHVFAVAVAVAVGVGVTASTRR